VRRHTWLTLLLVGTGALALAAAVAVAAPSGSRSRGAGKDGAAAGALAASTTPPPPAPAALDLPLRSADEGVTDPAVGASLPGLEVTDFRQNKPGDGEPVSENTKAYVSYDADNLHVVFVCDDDPARIRANVVPRERITDDDRVGVFLDTFDDNQRAYAFLVNPLGIQRDGILTEGQDDDWTFDALWYSEGHLTPTGYVVRMRIPFSSLRFARKSAQTWGVGLVRYIERKSEKSYWPYITERVEGFVNQLGSANGLAEISAGRRFVVVPYSVATNSRFLDEDLDIPAFRRLREGRLGLDAKAVLHDAVTVDVAANPDFSQIQPDDPQVTVNQRFEVRVEERRPFFVENAGFFQTPIELFFSRRIQDPRAGARLTSKLGPWAIGALFMDDREPGLVPPSDPMHGEHAYASVLRVQGEIGGSTVGLFASDRDLAGGSNQVFAADARFKLGKNWVATGQAVQARTRRPAETRVWGGGGQFKLKRSGRFLDCSADYSQLSPDFAADLGFIKRVGFREVGAKADYTFRPKKRIVTAWGPGLDVSWNWAWEGRLQDASVKASTKVEMPANTTFEAGWEETFELFRDLEFRLRTYSILGETNWLKWLSVFASYKRGSDVNHDPLKKVVPFSANAQETEMSVAVRPTSRLEFKQGLTYGWLHHGRQDPTLGPLIQPVFTNWILSSKLKYQISRELSLRAIVNYEAVVPNPTLSREDEVRTLVPDFLVTYLVNPWTAVHAGYTEQFENKRLINGEVVGDPASQDEFRLPRTSVDRQFFVKLSYLVRF